MQKRGLPCSFALSSAVVALLVACGSTTGTTVDGGGTATTDGGAADGASLDASAIDADARASDASGDAPDLTGPYTCGAKTCQTGEWCVHPCAGGVIPICIDKTDGGVCPPGSVTGSCLGDAGVTSTGCVPAPPPPFCSVAPACPRGMSTQPPVGRDIGCMCA